MATPADSERRRTSHISRLALVVALLVFGFMVYIGLEAVRERRASDAKHAQQMLEEARRSVLWRRQAVRELSLETPFELKRVADISPDPTVSQRAGFEVHSGKDAEIDVVVITAADEKSLDLDAYAREQTERPLEDQKRRGSRHVRTEIVSSMVEGVPARRTMVVHEKGGRTEIEQCLIVAQGSQLWEVHVGTRKPSPDVERIFASVKFAQP